MVPRKALSRHTSQYKAHTTTIHNAQAFHDHKETFLITHKYCHTEPSHMAYAQVRHLFFFFFSPSFPASPAFFSHFSHTLTTTHFPSHLSQGSYNFSPLHRSIQFSLHQRIKENTYLSSYLYAPPFPPQKPHCSTTFPPTQHMTSSRLNGAVGWKEPVCGESCKACWYSRE